MRRDTGVRPGPADEPAQPGRQAALDQAGYPHGALGVALRQAVHVGRWPRASACADIMERLCDTVPPLDRDRPLDTAIGQVADLLDEVASET